MWWYFGNIIQERGIILWRYLENIIQDKTVVSLANCRGCNPFMPTVAFNICCPRDCVSRHNGSTSGAPLKSLRVDSALRALSSLRGWRGAPEVPPLCRKTQSLGQHMLNATVGINGLQHTLCTQGNFSEVLLNPPEIRLYLPFSD